jgi:hypothetical protein
MLMCERRTGRFRPRLTLERTGYSGNGWQWVVWFLGSSGRLVNAGGPLVAQASPADALREYFDLLRRLGCRPWDGVERDRRKTRGTERAVKGGNRQLRV